MKMQNQTLPITTLWAALLLLFSCDSSTSSEDVVGVPNKDASVETLLSVKKEANYNVLVTTHKIWHDGKLDKTIVHHDTLQTLGETSQWGENSEGEQKLLFVPQNYEFYITVQ